METRYLGNKGNKSKKNTIGTKVAKCSKYAIFYIFHITPSISILCQNIILEKLMQTTFGDQTLYITNVCRVISRVTKVALRRNFRNKS